MFRRHSVSSGQGGPSGETLEGGGQPDDCPRQPGTEPPLSGCSTWKQHLFNTRPTVSWSCLLTA